MCATYLCGMKTFDDLKFSPWIGKMKRAEIKFLNGLYISVLTGPGSDTDAERPYEAALLDELGFLVRNSERRYLTSDQVSEFMIEIQEMK